MPRDNEAPSDVNAERTILAGILIDNEYFFDDSLDLTVEDFYLDSHRKIFQTMNEILMGMVEGTSHVDEVTLQNDLRKRKWLSVVGGAAYIAGLNEGIPRKLRLGEYIRIVKEKARLRKLIAIFSAAAERAKDQQEEAEKILSDVQGQTEEVSADQGSPSVDIGSVTSAVERRINEKRIISSEHTALEMTWGLSGLDDFTRGAFGGELTVLGAESSSGKTAFAVQMTLANAQLGIPCAWFSMEMSKEQICQRYYPAMSQILTSSHLRDPRLMNLHTHIPEMRSISAELARLPIKIDDTSPLRRDKLKARIRMMVRKFQIKLAVVDYIQLIEGVGGKNETEEFKKTVFMLRDIAKSEPTLHLLALSQYVKAEGFMRKKSRTKDSLYGGSVIHHAAQNVLMLSVESPDKREQNDLLDAEIRIAKQREGRTGKIPCNFDRDRLLFCYPQPPPRI